MRGRGRCENKQTVPAVGVLSAAVAAGEEAD